MITNNPLTSKLIGSPWLLNITVNGNEHLSHIWFLNTTMNVNIHLDCFLIDNINVIRLDLQLDQIWLLDITVNDNKNCDCWAPSLMPTTLRSNIINDNNLSRLLIIYKFFVNFIKFTTHIFKDAKQPLQNKIRFSPLALKFSWVLVR